MKKALLSLLALFFLLMLSSCTLNLTFTMEEDGSLAISLEGGAGQAFTKMLLSASGMTDADGEEAFLDFKEINYELAKSGFTNIQSQAQGTSSIRLSMLDKERNSYLFTSGLLTLEKDGLKINLKRKALVDFYQSADEQTRMILDLFLAPVFNDEVLSETEYIEMLATFYGQDAADEVKDSFINITINNLDGQTRKETIPFSRILCLN